MIQEWVVVFFDNFWKKKKLILQLRNPSANFSYATVLDTNTYQFFKRHVELSTMFRKMEGHNVKTPKDAIQQLLNGTLSGKLI